MSVYLQSVAVRTWISPEFKDCSWPWTLTKNKSSLSSWLAVSKLRPERPTLTLKLERPHRIQSFPCVLPSQGQRASWLLIRSLFSLYTKSVNSCRGPQWPAVDGVCPAARWWQEFVEPTSRTLSAPSHSVVTRSLLCTPAAANNRQCRWQLHTSRRYVTLHVTCNTICNITTRRMSTTCSS